MRYMSKLAGIISVIAGIIMMIAGATTCGMVSSQLGDENITVPKDASMFAGEQVKGPLTAYAQADVINHHALTASGGKTYAELGNEARQAEAAGDTAKATELTEARTNVMNGSFLRASLLTSVVAFGVSALVMGSGLLFTLLGLGLMALAKRALKRDDHVRHDDHAHNRVHEDRVVTRDRVEGNGSTATA